MVFIFVFIATIIFILALRPVSYRFGLVDHPTLRKNHNDRKEKRKGRYELKRNSRENKKSRHGRKSSNEINGHEKKKSKSPRHGRKEDDRIQRHTNHESESLTKMRQRRQEREQAEAQRAFMVRLEAKSLQSSRASDSAKHNG